MTTSLDEIAKALKCHACGGRLDEGPAWARVTFEGFPKSKLNGVSVLVHARCLSIGPNAGITMSRERREEVAQEHAARDQFNA